ncbi:MAG: cation diffusion facilitator family transporter [Spirochaetales bacterium]
MPVRALLTWTVLLGSVIAMANDEPENGSPVASERTKSILLASWIGIISNGILAVGKIVTGFFAHSVAVVSDGIDSSLDILTSILTMVAARITDRPPDVNHPYGHTRAETIATKALSFIIFFAGAQLAVGTIRHLVGGETRELPTLLAFVVTAISIAGKSGLAIYKFSLGKRTNSAMLVADAKNMKSDIFVSASVLAGLAFTHVLQMPILDSIAALLISIYIMRVAFGIFVDTNTELMEGHADPETYQKVFDAVDQVPGAEHPHRTRIREIGAFYIIDVDVEVDGSMSVGDAHEIAQQTEHAIRRLIPNVYDVMVHIEPIGNVEDAERYGLSQRKLDEHRR